MVAVREPVLKPVGITDLRPTQITVGMREVEGKRERLAREEGKESCGVSRQTHDSSYSGTQ